MTEVKFNFLNWRPDAEDYENDGLITADNLLHDTEGYLQILSNTTTSMTNFAAGSGGTINSVLCRPQGSLRIATSTGLVYAAAEIVDFNSNTLRALCGPVTNNALETGTGTTIATATSGVVTSFQLCELNDRIFFACHVEGFEPGGTAISLNQTGFATIE